MTLLSANWPLGTVFAYGQRVETWDGAAGVLVACELVDDEFRYGVFTDDSEYREVWEDDLDATEAAEQPVAGRADGGATHRRRSRRRPRPQRPDLFSEAT